MKALIICLRAYQRVIGRGVAASRVGRRVRVLEGWKRGEELSSVVGLEMRWLTEDRNVRWNAAQDRPSAITWWT